MISRNSCPRAGFPGDESERHLATETGAIIPPHDAFDGTEEIRERIDGGLGERCRSSGPLAAHERFRIMKDFAATPPDSPVRARLRDASSRDKPGRHCKDVAPSATGPSPAPREPG